MKVNVDLKKTTKATGKRCPSTKKYIIIGAIIGTVFVLMIVAPNLLSRKKFNSDNVGREVRIEWEEVNLRKGHSALEKVITTLHKGSSVTLTGNSYNCLIGNGIATDSWVEVELKNGTTGWVVTTSIEWT